MSESVVSSVVLDEFGHAWEALVDTMLSRSEHIIALRGAGSFNCISTSDADKIIEGQLIPRIESLQDAGRVSIIFDGDNDDPNYPDIGHIMGRLCDNFGENEEVDFYAVQKLGWYKYRKDLPTMRPLHSARGREYQTFLFPDGKFTGEHDHFSQHVRLAQSSKYEQWYIGACGQIASEQLADYNTKVAGVGGEHKVVVFRARISVEQEQKILRKLNENTDPDHRQRLLAAIERRSENPYGLLCTPEGEFVWKPEFSNLNIEVV